MKKSIKKWCKKWGCFSHKKAAQKNNKKTRKYICVKSEGGRWKMHQKNAQKSKAKNALKIFAQNDEGSSKEKIFSAFFRQKRISAKNFAIQNANIKKTGKSRFKIFPWNDAEPMGKKNF